MGSKSELDHPGADGGGRVGGGARVPGATDGADGVAGRAQYVRGAGT